MSWGKVIPKEWQVTGQFVEWLFMQFTFHIFHKWLKTQEIITCRGFKNSQNGYRGMCMSRKKVILRNEKWQIKLLSDFFYNSYLTILWMTQTQERVNS